jgi:hypothetical protein
MCFQSFCQAFDVRGLRREENISADLKTILAEKYPEDRATGFLAGDLRGAITVKIALQP